MVPRSRQNRIFEITLLSRKRYPDPFNDVTLDYNNAAQQFPTNVVAGVFSFREAEMLQSTTQDSERAPVAVKF